MGEFKFI